MTQHKNKIKLPRYSSQLYISLAVVQITWQNHTYKVFFQFFLSIRGADEETKSVSIHSPCTFFCACQGDTRCRNDFTKQAEINNNNNNNNNEPSDC